jgi:hypothetical protein
VIRGHGRSCAELLGLTGRTHDTSQDGPDLLDLLNDEPEDHCDGWDHC